ncbi:MAG: OmpA family protein [Bacteroidales bacterium]|nr:OmpA family protein [Bacteroidales bacterium]MDY0143639.1 OmpA family protein [Bacteroidales bacterium]
MKTIRLSLLFAISLLAIVLQVSAKKPQIKVSTNKSNTILLGDSITISWEAKYAKDVFCYEISNKKLPHSGSITVAPQQTSSYIFFSNKRNQSKRKRINITVLPPTIVNFNLPAEITDEETASINWVVENAEYVKIGQMDNKFSLTGKIPLRSNNDTTITITAINKNGYAQSESKKVKINYVESLDYPSRVARNDNANISWEYKNADSVKFIGISSVLPPAGDIYIPVKENRKIRIEIYRKDGTFEVKDFTIYAYDSNIKHFSGNKTFFKGDEIILSWIVENADSVRLSCSDDVQELKGFIKYKPESDENITLTAYLNGVEDKQVFKTHIIRRKYITGETDYTKIRKNIRLDYEIFSTDLSEFPDVVKLYVLVVDSAGNFIHGLAPPTISENESKKHFIGLAETYTGGKSSSISDFKVQEYVSSEIIPRDISMVLDYSGSMQEPINTLEYAAKSFINNKFDQDKLGIIKFDDNILCLNELTDDKSILNKNYQVKGLNGFGGGTALYAAIGEGIYMLDSAGQHKEVIVFTDGYENSSFFVRNAKAITALEVAKQAKENNIKITCISFGAYVNKPLLEVLASYTGGKYFGIQSNKEITGVWTELPYLSANYYVISFRTKSIDKLNGVKLTYNNNIGQKITTDKKIHIALPDELDEAKSLPNAYWQNFDSLYNNKKPVSIPQAIGYFNFNGHILIEDYVKNVELLVEHLEQDTALDVVIFGHTDMVDTDEYNMRLSNERCNWAKKYFIEKGISETRIITIPLGEEYPIYNIEDEDWKAAENRRIEVLLLR